ncbi:hypothetical protein [Isoalcanivorax beigongshangi]|uniref:Uncharacterized protein n=1 Tax=Isoalcanivorax beigongshangi TaxID=3238810 RepID=A0ABV4AM22_9GAMM
MQDVVAIPASPELVRSTEQFLTAVANRGNGADAFIDLVDQLTNTLLSLFLEEPAKMARLTSGQQKVIDFAVGTAGKASHMLTRQIYKKTTNEEFAPIVRNIEAMYWRASDENDQQAMIALPVDAGFAADFRRATDASVSGNGREVVDLTVDVMGRFIDMILDRLFLEQTRHVKIGFVTKKALDLGVEGSRKALHSVTSKVLHGLSNDELAGYMTHFGQVLRQRA